MSDQRVARDAFSERMFASALGYFDILSIYVGLRLGLYASLGEGGSLTSAALADRAGIHQRYAREWLEQQTSRGILSADLTGPEPRFALAAGHAEVLLDPDSLSFLGAGVRQLVSLRGVIDDVVDAFRTGRGIPYDAYGSESVDGQGYGNRPTFLTTLPNGWLPAIPAVHERLQGEALVVDVGCGSGWSSIAIGRAYPRSNVNGVDPDAASIEAAQRNAAEMGVSDRVRFHLADGAAIAQTIEGPIDVATAFECVHDMARPVEVLGAVRRALADDGMMLIVDERTKDAFTGEPDDLEAYFYGWSIFDCLPTGMHEQPSAGTGTVMRPGTLEGYAEAAGFSGFEVLPIEHDSFRLYLLRP